MGAVLFFLLVPVLFTYPLFFLGPHRIYGLQEDITRYLHLFWCIQKNGDWLFQHRHYPQLNAPWGWEVQNTAQRFFWWLGAAYSEWVSPWTFNNWVIALSFPLSGYFFFRLAFELTGSFWGSLLGGFLFMFSPWHFAKAEAYPEMASIEWVPLYGWAFLKFLKSPSFRTGIVAGLVFVAAFNFSYVLGAMMGLVSLAILLGWFFFHRLKNRPWSDLPGGALAVFALIHGVAFFGLVWDHFSGIQSGTFTALNAFHRTAGWKDLALGTVGLEHFFLPTYYHPLWGGAVGKIMEGLKPGSWLVEDVVNPGFVCWGLALAAMVQLFRGKFLWEKKLGWTLVALGGMSAWLCLNPQWGKTLLPFPNVLLYNFFPAFRFYERFGVFVSFAFCLLAVMGFAGLAGAWKGRAQAILMTGLMVLAGFELYCPTQDRILDISKVPPEYTWLQEQPGDPIAAEYPMMTRFWKYEPRYLLWQIYHGKRLFNLEYQNLGQKPEEVALRDDLADFTSPKTVQKLQRFGVRYIVAHKIYYLVDQDPSRDPAPLLPRFRFAEKIPGLKLVQDWNTFSIYEVLPR